MRSTLQAIDHHPKLSLQLIITGMHFDRRHGSSVDVIRAEGWLERRDHAEIPWQPAGGTSAKVAIATGKTIAAIAASVPLRRADVVLVVGDRVEAFAGAAAGHIAGKIVAHVHGGDRALGQVDDSLRHAITKLAHIHFPATRESADRILKLGEDRRRIHQVGSPGIDGIAIVAASWDSLQKRFPTIRRHRYALLVLHPTSTDAAAEQARAGMVLQAVRKTGFGQTIVVYPNNDPGSAGILRCWKTLTSDRHEIGIKNLTRPAFLGLMRDAAVLVGNSSSGIIEAASFGTPVLDIGPRQQGRERSGNVTNVGFTPAAIGQELRRIWNSGKSVRYPKKNVYGGGGAGERIAGVLAKVVMDEGVRKKLIAY